MSMLKTRRRVNLLTIPLARNRDIEVSSGAYAGAAARIAAAENCQRLREKTPSTRFITGVRLNTQHTASGPRRIHNLSLEIQRC
jgi:hypothetical protein